MRARTFLRRSTGALLVTVLIAAVYSLSEAQGVSRENKWQVVNPKLLPADVVGKGMQK